jgi:hypothetical protein
MKEPAFSAIGLFAKRLFTPIPYAVTLLLYSYLTSFAERLRDLEKRVPVRSSLLSFRSDLLRLSLKELMSTTQPKPKHYEILRRLAAVSGDSDETLETPNEAISVPALVQSNPALRDQIGYDS